MTLRAKLKKGLRTALKTVGRTLVSCQPELAAGQTRHKVAGTRSHDQPVHVCCDQAADVTSNGISEMQQ